MSGKFIMCGLHTLRWKSEGAVVHIVEPDDGSGWVKVVDEDGDRGLVPASYLESVQEASGGKAKTAQRGSGKRGMC